MVLRALCRFAGSHPRSTGFLFVIEIDVDFQEKLGTSAVSDSLIIRL